MSLYDRKAAILHNQTPSRWSTVQVRRLRCAVVSMSTAICIALATLASATMRDSRITAIVLAMSMATGAAAALVALVNAPGVPRTIRHSFSRKTQRFLSSFLIAVPSFVILATGMLIAFSRVFPSALYAHLNIILVTIAMPSAGLAIFIGSLFFFPPPITLGLNSRSALAADQRMAFYFWKIFYVLRTPSVLILDVGVVYHDGS